MKIPLGTALAVGSDEFGAALSIYGILFAIAAGWIFYRKLTDARLLDDGVLDPRISQRLATGGVFYPENKEPRRPYREYFRFGLIFAFVVLLTASMLPSFVTWILCLASLGSAAWMYFYSEPPAGRLPEWANFQKDHLVVTALDGTRAVFVLGSRVTIMLEVVRAPAPLFGWEPPPNEHQFFMNVTEGVVSARLPLEFVGSGEFLGLCRKEGVKVGFYEGTPGWFVSAMKRLPSWGLGYFEAKAEPAEPTATLTCGACGAVGSYAKDRRLQLCQFCGSAELRPPSHG
jgi:hypothetical protein